MLCVNPVNLFDVCHADQLLPLYIAYCVVDAFIPDKLSVCLHVTVTEFVVTLVVGAAVVGAFLSTFIMYSPLFTVFVPSVVVTTNFVVPDVVIVVADDVAATVCAEPDTLAYVVVPAEPLFNVTYTLSFVHVFAVYAAPLAFVCFNVKLPAVKLLVVTLNSADSDEFPALSVVFVFTLYVLLVVNPLNTFDDCQLHQLLPLYIAYCVLDTPDKASVCLFVTVIEFVV